MESGAAVVSDGEDEAALVEAALRWCRSERRRRCSKKRCCGSIGRRGGGGVQGRSSVEAIHYYSALFNSLDVNYGTS
jgi:hypothetical protein